MKEQLKVSGTKVLKKLRGNIISIKYGVVNPEHRKAISSPNKEEKK